MSESVHYCKRCNVLLGYYEDKKTFEFCLDCVKLNILILTLKKHWFDLILMGAKRIEYRLVKKHWRERLIKNYEPVKFDEILFINGYGNDKPYFFIEYVYLKYAYKDVENLVDLKGKKHYAIKMGNIKFTGNIKDETIII